MPRNIKGKNRDFQLRLLKTIATRRHWVSVSALHFLSEVYPSPAHTRGAIAMLMHYGLVAGEIGTEEGNFYITLKGRSALAASPEAALNFFTKLREFTGKTDTCEQCGKSGMLYLFKKRLLCSDCFNPDYTPSYNFQRRSSSLAHEE
jgi:hypothetical protein